MHSVQMVQRNAHNNVTEDTLSAKNTIVNYDWKDDWKDVNPVKDIKHFYAYQTWEERHTQKVKFKSLWKPQGPSNNRRIPTNNI